MNQDAESNHADDPENETEQSESKIHAEEAKDRQTTHWDMDYLPTEQVEAAHRDGTENQEDSQD